MLYKLVRNTKLYSTTYIADTVVSTMNAFLILLFTTVLLGCLTDNVDATCISNNQTYIEEGMSFSPEGTDDCTTCLCKDSEPTFCNVLECTPPTNKGCKSYIQLDGCCKYSCQLPDEETN